MTSSSSSSSSSSFPVKLHAVFRIPTQVGPTNTRVLQEIRVFRLTRSSFRTDDQESVSGFSSQLVVLGSDIVHLLLAGSSHASQHISLHAMEKAVPSALRVKLFMADFPSAYCYDGLVVYLNSIVQIDVPRSMLDVITYHVLPFMLTGRVTPTHDDESAVKTVIAQPDEDDEDDLYCYETMEDPAFPNTSSDSDGDDHEEVIYIDVSNNTSQLSILANLRQQSMDYSTGFASPTSNFNNIYPFQQGYNEQQTDDMDMSSLSQSSTKYTASCHEDDDDITAISQLGVWSIEPYSFAR